ncbi:MAG: calcium-binding protein, partial [Planctomycetes bacterium]|nr:calcium-binding protein [Planctomycetota bacterium]
MAGVCFGQSTERVSLDSAGNEGNAWSDIVDMSPDGRFLTFESDASNLVAGDTGSRVDIFVHDRLTGQTVRASINSLGQAPNKDCVRPVISDNGRYVAFETLASNMFVGDVNGQSDVFVHDLLTGKTEHVNINSQGEPGNDFGCNASMSADGRFIAFHGHSTNLVPNDTNADRDAFLHDRLTGLTERISVSTNGDEGAGSSGDPILSADGMIVAFQSSAPNLVAGDTNGTRDIFVRDRQAGTTVRVSVSSTGGEANDHSQEAAVSADGRFIAFTSLASNLVAGDTNGHRDVFVHDRQTGMTVTFPRFDGHQRSGQNDRGDPCVQTSPTYLHPRA